MQSAKERIFATNETQVFLARYDLLKQTIILWNK